MSIFSAPSIILCKWRIRDSQRVSYSPFSTINFVVRINALVQTSSQREFDIRSRVTTTPPLSQWRWPFRPEECVKINHLQIHVLPMRGLPQIQMESFSYFCIRRFISNSRQLVIKQYIKILKDIGLKENRYHILT